MKTTIALLTTALVLCVFCLIYQQRLHQKNLDSIMHELDDASKVVRQFCDETDRIGRESYERGYSDGLKEATKMVETKLPPLKPEK